MTELLQAISALVAAVGGLVVALLALCQWRKALRWRQGKEARKLLDDLFLSDKHAGYDALLMTDLPGGVRDDFEDRRFSNKVMRKVSHTDVIEALRKAVQDGDLSVTGVFILSVLR